MKINGEPATREIILLAHAVDRLGLILSGLSGSEKKPESIINLIYGSVENKEDNDIKTFATSDEFEKAKAILLKGGII